MKAESRGKKKILVVDDDTFLLNFLNLVLQKSGYQVLTAQGGEEGLEIVRKEKPQIILSDLMMPGMDGREFLRRVKQQKDLQDVLFIILTARTEKSDRIELLNQGADDFINKPISKDELLAKLGAFERLQDLQTELRHKNEILQKLNRKLQQTTLQLKKTNEELKTTQDQLIHSEKLASIGHLAAGLAHEINNPLGFVYSNLNVLKNYIADIRALLNRYEMLAEKFCGEHPETCKEAVQEIERFKKEIDFDFMMPDLGKLVDDSLHGAERVKEIVENLRDFSDLDHSDYYKTNLQNCLEMAISVVGNEIRFKAELIREYSDVPDFYCYPKQLSQVFVNLLLNAANAIKEKGRIVVRTFAEENRAVAEIEDDGIGIPKEILPRVFEPFFTTKEVGEGTGLGLSVSYNIIKRHGGDIRIESEIGKGTKVRVELPLKTDEDLLPVKASAEVNEIKLL